MITIYIWVVLLAALGALVIWHAIDDQAQADRLPPYDGWWVAVLVACFVAVGSPAEAEPAKSESDRNSGVAVATSWDLQDMNKTVDQTNFVVDRGCSGTLVSLTPPRILTNFHCVSSKISVRERDEPQADGTVKKVKREERERVSVDQHHYSGYTKVGTSSYFTKIVAHEKRKDLALLQVLGSIPQHTYTPVLPDKRSVTRGETVYIVGNPNGLDATVVEGIVSSVSRSFKPPFAEGQWLDLIQFSGGVAGGNSGGALYNIRGELVGVPAARFGANHLGLAIPASTVREFLKGHCQASVYDPKADDKACREAKKPKKDK